MNDLLPCPNCNMVPVDSPTQFGEDEDVLTGWGWVVHCSNHHLKRTARTREQAVEKWNLTVLLSMSPEFDSDGYPSDKTLEYISQWPVSSRSGLRALFDFIQEALNLDYGSFSVEDEKVRIVTGGWSGNESVIGALQQNYTFWGLCWESSHRGGLHWFYSPSAGVVEACLLPKQAGCPTAQPKEVASDLLTWGSRLRTLIVDQAPAAKVEEEIFSYKLGRADQPGEGGVEVGETPSGPKETRLDYDEFQKIRVLAKAKYGSPGDEKHFGSIPIVKVFTGTKWDLVVDLRQDPWFFTQGVYGLSTVYLDPGLWPFREELEACANLCHQQWTGWMEYLFQKSSLNDDGSVTIPSELVFRWKRQCETSYKKLTPQEQESDRKEAVRFFRLFLSFLRESPSKEGEIGAGAPSSGQKGISLDALVGAFWKGRLEMGTGSEKCLLQPPDKFEAPEAEPIILNSDLRPPEEIIKASDLCPEDKAGLLQYVAFRRDRARAEKNAEAYAEFRKIWGPELKAMEREGNQNE